MFQIKKYNSSLKNLTESQKYNIELLNKQMRVKQKTVIKLKELLNNNETNISKSNRNAYYYLENYKKNKIFYNKIRLICIGIFIIFIIILVVYLIKLSINR